MLSKEQGQANSAFEFDTDASIRRMYANNIGRKVDSGVKEQHLLIRNVCSHTNRLQPHSPAYVFTWLWRLLKTVKSL